MDFYCLLKLLTVLVIVFVQLAVTSLAQEILEISSNTSCSNEDGSINITYSCTASCGDVPSLILLINGEPKEPIDPHIDVATKCTQDMCVTNINTNLECNSQSGNITRTIEDYIVTNSPQCTNGSSNISLATVTVTTTVTECSLNLESSYISFPSPSIIPSPSLYISTVTTSKVTSPSSSQSLSLSLSSSLSTTSQYTTTSTLTRSSSSLTRSSSSLSDNISLTSSTEPTLTTQGLTIVQGVGGAASVLMLLVIGLSVSVVVMGVCLCRVKYKKINRQYVAKNNNVGSETD